MLNISMLTIGYGGKVIASDLTAVLPTGSLTALVGRNGMGKSTLLRTIAGLLPPLAGCVSLDDGTASQRLTAHDVAIVLTSPVSAGALTVADVVALGRIPHTGLTGRLHEADFAAIDHALELCAIGHLRERRIAHISDGERQRVMIARAIAQDTPIILLDEPTAFLDFPTKVSTLQLLKELCANGKTILLSTHDLELTFQFADRLWMFDKGRLVEGTPNELAADGSLAALAAGLVFDPHNLRFNL